MNTPFHSIRFFLFALFTMLLCVCSCHRAPSEADRLLDRVDSLCYVDPDSAVTLVSQLPDSIVATWPEATRMRYHLMHIKALDKAYLDITGDTVMPTVLSYYQSHSDHRFLPEAYFYSGRVCADIGDAPQAMKYYTQALQVTEETEQTQQIKILKAVIYSQMGVVCRAQSLMGDALDYAHRALECNSFINNTTGMIFNLCDLADYYSYINENDSALIYAEKAEEIADSAQLETMWSKAKFSKAIIYYKNGCYQEALETLRDAMPCLGSYALHNARYYLASLYHLTGQIDSASYYYHELINDSVVFDKAVAYKELAQLSLAYSKYELADSLYYESFYAYDLARIQTQSEATKRVQQVYNYQLHERKADRLERENEQKGQKLVVLIIIVVALIVLGALSVRLNYMQQSKAILLKKNINLLAALVQEQEEDLKILASEKDKLERENSDFKRDVEQKQTELHKQQEIQYIVSTDTYQFLNKKLQSGSALSPSDWPAVEELVCGVYEKFQSRMSVLHLNETEWRVCLLLKLGFSPNDIGKLTCRSKTTISTLRTRLSRRFLSSEKGSTEWDSFISSM